MTNADKIRSMTDEELAKIICCQDLKHGNDCFKTSCIDCTIEWLNKEAEQTMSETKRKTMMEDFFEKFPDAPRDESGSPAPCPSDVYNVSDLPCGYDNPRDCRACWSRPVPPQRECYKNATVIVEYDKSGEPIISWVRQEDTVRIGYDEAMKGVKIKVKAVDEI